MRRAVAPNAKIILLIANNSPATVLQVLDAGSRGYVVKSEIMGSPILAVKSSFDHKP